MSVTPECSRCGGALRPPGLMSSGWRCEHDGVVEPLFVTAPVAVRALKTVAAHAQVPVWLPSPPPVGWTLGGLAYAGDERTGARATLVAWCGPSPLGGLADLLLVAEEPGVGLGARFAGLPGLDAGEAAVGAPFAKVEVLAHPTALWLCPQAPADRAVLVGEAAGAWLWMLLWPAHATALLLEHLMFVDAREGVGPVDVGAGSTRLRVP